MSAKCRRETGCTVISLLGPGTGRDARNLAGAHDCQKPDFVVEVKVVVEIGLPEVSVICGSAVYPG